MTERARISWFAISAEFRLEEENVKRDQASKQEVQILKWLHANARRYASASTLEKGVRAQVVNKPWLLTSAARRYRRTDHVDNSHHSVIPIWPGMDGQWNGGRKRVVQPCAGWVGRATTTATSGLFRISSSVHSALGAINAQITRKNNGKQQAILMAMSCQCRIGMARR